MTIIATIEIFIRNSLCNNLQEFFGSADWLFNPPPSFEWKKPEHEKIRIAAASAKRAEYAKLNHQEKVQLDAIAFPHGRPAGVAHTAVSKRRQSCITVTTGKIIAELTFYFWKRLYGPDYQHSLWKRTLKKTFPNKKIDRSEIADSLETIYQTRNRLAHHEPVLHGRYSDAINSIKFISENLGLSTRDDNSTLCKLIAPDIAELTSRSNALHARIESFKT